MGGTLFTALAAYSGCTAARWYLDRSSRRDTDRFGGRVRLKSMWNEGAAFSLPLDRAHWVISRDHSMPWPGVAP